MSKPLILFYSRAGQNWYNGGIRDLPVGNTRIAAEKIHALIDSDMFEIRPEVEYGIEYRECTDKAAKEWRANARPEVEKYPDCIKDRDNIVVCYPNWCGTLPMFMFTALEKYDLSGKNIFPLCTNEGSGMGNSEADLKKNCKGAEIHKGLPIIGHKVAESGKAIEEWLRSSGLL